VVLSQDAQQTVVVLTQDSFRFRVVPFLAQHLAWHGLTTKYPCSRHKTCVLRMGVAIACTLQLLNMIGLVNEISARPDWLGDCAVCLDQC
jgi:hypothetical protein